MIAIVDSGSTKSDWVLLNENKEEIFRTITIGLNPHFITKEEINLEVKKNKLLAENKSSIIYIKYRPTCHILSLLKMEIIKKNTKGSLNRKKEAIR